MTFSAAPIVCDTVCHHLNSHTRPTHSNSIVLPVLPTPPKSFGFMQVKQTAVWVYNQLRITVKVQTLNWLSAPAFTLV